MKYSIVPLIWRVYSSSEFWLPQSVVLPRLSIRIIICPSIVRTGIVIFLVLNITCLLVSSLIALVLSDVLILKSRCFFSMNYVHISFVDHHTYVNKNNLFMKARKQISTLFTCWLLFSSLLISQHFSNYASGLHQVYTHSGNIEAITN